MTRAELLEAAKDTLEQLDRVPDEPRFRASHLEDLARFAKRMLEQEEARFGTIQPSRFTLKYAVNTALEDQ